MYLKVATMHGRLLGRKFKPFRNIFAQKWHKTQPIQEARTSDDRSKELQPQGHLGMCLKGCSYSSSHKCRSKGWKYHPIETHWQSVTWDLARAWSTTLWVVDRPNAFSFSSKCLDKGQKILEISTEIKYARAPILYITFICLYNFDNFELFFFRFLNIYIYI